MAMSKGNILWIDDEIELLKPHIILLEQRGFKVDQASNGEDGIELVKRGQYDLIFLDETMIGMTGLDTLPILKDIDPGVKIVMVTKNEAESVMEEAIGKKIDDYLTKPVNPAQIIAACKKFLETRRIQSEKLSQDYFQGFNEISRRLFEPLEWEDWTDIYEKLVGWSMELDANPDLGYEDTLRDQWRECNSEFSKFVEKNYGDWIEGYTGSPLMSNGVVEHSVFPKLDNGKPTFFFVVDCMRFDQWLTFEELLRPYYSFSKEFYSSILPTATPYARNAIFAGLYPSEIRNRYPDYWLDETNNEEHKLNAYEKELLWEQIKRKKIKLKGNMHYIKIHDTDFGKKIETNIQNNLKNHLTAIVINAVDMIAHSRSDYPILKEIAPDESAYRSLSKSWFMHSSLFGMLKTLANHDVNIVITTDHGSIRCMRGVKVIGDRNTSTCLRYKFGKNVKAESKHAMFIKKPEEYKLPSSSMTINNIIAKEDYYFVYPTEFHHYLQRYRDSFQHGGISLEEMIIPIIHLERK